MIVQLEMGNRNFSLRTRIDWDEDIFIDFLIFDEELGRVSTVAVHISLLLGVFAYTVVGALVIQFLESSEEPNARLRREGNPNVFTRVYLGSEISAMDPKVHQCLEWAVKRVMQSTDCDDYQMEHINIDLIDECYENVELPPSGLNNVPLIDSGTKEIEVSTQPTIEDEIAKEVEKWSFGNALIFTFSVITTIGYGHIAPETFSGRLFCIFFGLVGVPFTLLTVADLGMFISMIMREAVSRIGSLFHKCTWNHSKVQLQTSLPSEGMLSTARDLKSQEDEEDDEQSEDTPPRLATVSTLENSRFNGRASLI
ncbi:Ion channel [Teladorsagia circumcincta]|uniref:Ion channel n=1 Tax=Teladorsagia circumcincta TaxID=45464 RepID=A0A2G9ULP1_TELCI|nr:Ion channel [Teladorsagia circumcincta]